MTGRRVHRDLELIIQYRWNKEMQENERNVQDKSVIIFEFTDNKSLALKPTSYETRHEVDTYLACGKEKRVSGFCRSIIPSSSVNGPSRHRPVKSQGMRPGRSLDPSQTSVIVVGMRTTPLLC